MEGQVHSLRLLCSLASGIIVITAAAAATGLGCFLLHLCAVVVVTGSGLLALLGFIGLGDLVGNGHVGLSLLHLEEPEDEEAVVSELAMHLELLMDLFLLSVVSFSLPLLFSCSSISYSWLMVLDLCCLPNLLLACT